MGSSIDPIARYIEYTNLDPKITGKDVDNLIKEALDHKILGVCVPPFWVKRAAREIGNNDLQLITTAGYPLGFHMTETKMEETRLALRDGANEIDVVLNFTSFAEGLPWTKIELVKLSKLIHDEGAFMKVIVETDLWTSDQLLKILRLCADAGVDFVKTSTGYHRAPVSVEIIRSIRGFLPSNVGIKASGGIRSLEVANALIEAGADRIGTSSLFNSGKS